MEKVETPWCPCQEELFEEEYPALERKMSYLGGVTLLERVHSGRVCDIPTNYTRRGNKITEENFPEKSFVCPSCEQVFDEEQIVRKKK